MNIAIILAGGIGLRTRSKIPKQLLLINDKPIFIHTIECFLKTKIIDKIILVFNEKFILEAEKNIKKFISLNNQVILIGGGKTRNESINKAYLYLKKLTTINFNDIIITHDSVRMFFNKKLLKELILMATKFNGVCVPIIPMLNSVLKINNNKIKMVPRENLFQIQTPQVLKFKILDKLFQSSHYIKNKNPNWELCWLAEKNKILIKTCHGDVQNIKLTELNDIEMIKAIASTKKK